MVVLSKFGSTIGDLPSDFTEFPMFPGIDPSRIVGKKFETLAIDIQIIKDEKIKRSWHFEDWVCTMYYLCMHVQKMISFLQLFVYILLLNRYQHLNKFYMTNLNHFFPCPSQNLENF